MKSSISKQIAQRIKQARTNKGFSQETLGRKLQVRPQTVLRWEKGEGLCSQLETFRQFCLETNSDANEILGLIKNE